LLNLVGFVSVSNEFVLTIKVEKCIPHDLELVMFVNVGACRVKCFAGLNGSGHECFSILEVFVNCILLKDLPEII
jgi:hypothetical protein